MGSTRISRKAKINEKPPKLKRLACDDMGHENTEDFHRRQAMSKARNIW